MTQQSERMFHADGEPVSAADMTSALTAAPLRFRDGSTQEFTADGRTSYVERGRTATGQWSVLGDGKFLSFWPPDYRATYSVRWIADGSATVGVSFTEDGGSQRFDGRYQ